MRDEEILLNLEMAHRDPASTPVEALARVRVRMLKALVSEHLSRADWNLKQADFYQAELDKVLAEHGWEEPEDTTE